MDIVIYTRDNCAYCEKAKNLLKSINLEFQEVLLTNSPEDAQKLFDVTGAMTFPQIIIDNEFIGGCSELEDLYNQNKLGVQK